MTTTLTLPLKAEYFHAINSGEKTEEFRLANAYWNKRLDGRTYDELVLTLGYPKKGDESRRIRLPWRGYRVTTRQHKEFGPTPVEVYAIALTAGLEKPQHDRATSTLREGANGVGHSHG